MVRGVEFKDEIDRTDALVMINQCLDLYLNVPSYGCGEHPRANGPARDAPRQADGRPYLEKVYEVKGVVAGHSQHLDHSRGIMRTRRMMRL